MLSVAYPCRTLEKATALAARFIVGVTKPARRTPSTINSQPSAAPVAA